MLEEILNAKVDGLIDLVAEGLATIDGKFGAARRLISRRLPSIHRRATKGMTKPAGRGRRAGTAKWIRAILRQCALGDQHCDDEPSCRPTHGESMRILTRGAPV